MAAVLGTWNPERWHWNDLESAIDATARGRGVVATWSVSNRKHGMLPGDAFYLLKVGRPPRGLIASGLVLSEPYAAPHWDGTPGRSTQMVDIEFRRVVGPRDVLPASVLMDELTHTNWKPQSSGTSIHPGDVDSLEELWERHIAQL